MSRMTFSSATCRARWCGLDQWRIQVGQIRLWPPSSLTVECLAIPSTKVYSCGKVGNILISSFEPNGNITPLLYLREVLHNVLRVNKQKRSSRNCLSRTIFFEKR